MLMNILSPAAALLTYDNQKAFDKVNHAVLFEEYES